MKVLLSWVRDFVDVPGTPEEIGRRMSLRGLALEGLEPIEPGPHPPGRSPDGPDAVLDFDVTANRPDCLSMLGIAREIATAYGLPLRTDGPLGDDAPAAMDAGIPSAITVSIDDADLCARYAAAVADVRLGSSPDWIAWRLQACGVRPISNIVDITNYVLLERGYPMHAFDLARLAGPAIVVRRARAGERLTTLDGKARVLEPGMLVIADAERPAAIAGVMGGADSEVSATTTAIVLEAAWFRPPSVRATSKRLGLRTEASYRFERGVDLTATADAMARAIALIESTGAGRARGPITDACPAPHVATHLTLAPGAAEQLLGMHVPDDDTERILHSLGFVAEPLGGWHAAAPEAATPLSSPGAGWRIEVPGWRVDIARPVDIIEEIGRHYGFEHLPTTFPAVTQAPPPSDSRIARDARVRRVLLAHGFSEAITFAFIAERAAEPFADGTSVTLANPLSETFTTLRPSLLPGLLDAASHNRRHGRRDVRLFEIGTRFATAGETRAVAAIWTGAAAAEHWSGGGRDVDFFDVRGVAEQIGAAMGVDVTCTPVTRHYLVNGRAASVDVNGTAIGVIGQLDPALGERRDLPGADAIYVLELSLDALSGLTPTTTRFAQALPRHPAIVRDISILVDDSLSADTVRGTIRAAGPLTLVEVREFDRYQGKGIPDGKISLSLRLTFQAPDRTLTDAEVQAAMLSVMTALRSSLGAVQR